MIPPGNFSHSKIAIENGPILAHLLSAASLRVVVDQRVSLPNHLQIQVTGKSPVRTLSMAFCGAKDLQEPLIRALEMCWRCGEEKTWENHWTWLTWLPVASLKQYRKGNCLPKNKSHVTAPYSENSRKGACYRIFCV